VVADEVGNVFVADSGNNNIRQVLPDRSVATISGYAGTPGQEDGPGWAASFYAPVGIAKDAALNFYIAELGNHTLRHIFPWGDVETLAGMAPRPGISDGANTAAGFYHPGGIGLDRGGNAYVADYENHTIRKVTPLGVVTTLAGSAGLTNSTDGQGTAARFNHPADATADSSGNVYVADTWNHTIRKIAPDGLVTTFAGLAGTAGTNNGTGSAARFNNPIGVTVDLSNYVYVADYGSHTIRKVSPAGVVTTLAGLAGASGSANGTGSVARFSSPHGVAVDTNGNVYVADYGNDSIRKVTASGAVITFAGLSGFFGSADGLGANARFNYPTRVAVDIGGNVYVSDNGNHTIRKVTPTGLVITLGGAVGISTVVDGAGTGSRINSPEGIGVHSSGRLYISSFQENVIILGSPTNEAPFHFTQPLSLTRQEGFAATFSAAAAGALPITYQWRKDGVPIPNATNTSYTISPVALSNAGTYAVVASNEFGFAVSSNAVLTVIPAVPLAEALDAPVEVWTTGGDAAWFGQSVSALDGVDAAQSGILGIGQQAWLETTVQGPGTVAFWWKSSDPSGTAGFSLSVNGSFYTALGGETDWQRVTVALSGGAYTLRWLFSNGTGTGYGQVDQFIFTQPPFITVHPAAQSTFPGSNILFSVNAVGPGLLSYQWQKDGINLLGARRSTYTATNVQAVDAGAYRVLVGNAYGATTSSNAMLTVLNTQAVQFVRSGTITIPSSGTATPYPSTLAVSNFPGLLARMEVTLSNLAHTFPSDVDILLVGPGGQKVMLMSDVGGGTSVTNLLLQFSDFAPGPLDSSALVSGLYLPTDLDPGETMPLTTPPYGTSLSAFNDTSPNGTWSLYIFDDATGDAGSLAGWSLKLYSSTPPVLTQQPQPLMVGVGQPAAFEVGASSSLPLSYQWRKNSNPIAGATNRSHSVTATSLNDAGLYSVVVSSATGVLTSSVARLVVVSASGIPVAFADDFEANSSGGWLVFPGFTNGVADYAASFAHDYGAFFSSFNIGPAPNSAPGTTRGLRLTVNKNDAVAATAAVSLYPRDQSFTGACALKFDLWLNYPGTNGGGGGVGSTENAAFGLNHAGTRVNWDAANSTPSDGVWFSMTGQGGFTNDYRAYVGNAAARPTLLPFATSGIPVSGATGHDNTNSYFTNLFPSPTYETPGAPGKRWVQVEVSQNASNVLAWRINGSLIALRTNTSSFTNGNLMLGYMDLEPNIASPATNSFVLFDNVRLEQDPATFLPVLTSQPTNQSVFVGETATFATTATGLGPFQYLWRKAGVVIPGATNATFTLTNSQLGDNGSFSVAVSNAVGGIVSSNVALIVSLQPVQITVPPVNLSVLPGGLATFNVAAIGTPPLSYQWQFNGANLPGATHSTYDVMPTTLGAAGGYRVIITNLAGNATSVVAFLSVQTPGLVSLSAPQMVKDINLVLSSASSSPSQIVQVGSLGYFTAADAIHGTELWKTDGTSAGTVMVKDIFPGSSSSSCANLVNVNGVLFFTANDGVNGIELWKSDGSRDGTVMVADLRNGSLSSAPANLLNANGTLFFTASAGTNGVSTSGVELWKSDGTTGGTVMVRDIAPGSLSSSPANLTMVSTNVFFSASDGTNGVELWKSDGTFGGTALVADIRAGSGSSSPASLVDLNGTLLFAASTATNGVELWKSDGTLAGTVLVADVRAGASASSPANLINVNGTLFFTANDGTNGVELWVSDGTTPETSSPAAVRQVRRTSSPSATCCISRRTIPATAWNCGRAMARPMAR
jgi:ELWxxDGT repeat protein